MYNVKNCFGFEEEDANISLWNNSSVLSSTLAPIEFQADKPYRLALYIKPSERRKKVVTNAFSLLKREKINSTVKKNEINKSSAHKNVNSTKKNKSGRKVNVMLFDENVVPPNDKKVSWLSKAINNFSLIINFFDFLIQKNLFLFFFF